MDQIPKLNVTMVGIYATTPATQDIVTVGFTDGSNSSCRHLNSRTGLRHALSKPLPFLVAVVIAAIFLLLLLLLRIVRDLLALPFLAGTNVLVCRVGSTRMRSNDAMIVPGGFTDAARNVSCQIGFAHH